MEIIKLDYSEPIISECCFGCTRSAPGTNLECSVYGMVPNLYCRLGACPINPKDVAPIAKGKVRVGQQKTKRNRG